ncbi:LRR RECEPTOR-LIKE KINASE [Salix viminalis]|uniref:LRR RECEPTOR-LIKE KINASE n=1 Tax=Salix viminalis TaxID=40686 RepID=A0A9Q0P9W6_SALVM|nr:LRR RECEPTOR-LIKE KINASE [Salix viminalis]
MKPKRNLLLLITFFVFLSLNSFSTVESDLASERAALVTLRDAVGGRSLLWNLSDNPCQWVGVFCDQKRTTVVELRLPGMGLSGQLPVALGNLTSLQTLSVRFNALSGPIPADIGNIVSLRVISPSFNNLTRLDTLYLEENQLTGSIPDLNLPLDQFNVSFNNLTGPVPLKLSNKPVNSFQGTLLCGKPLVSCNGPSNGNSK